MKIAILGNGGFGTAMAMVAERAGNEVRLWEYEVEYTVEMARTRENPVYLPAVRVPDSILVTTDPAETLAGAEVVLFGVPTQFLRGVTESVSSMLPREVPLVSLAKGLEDSCSLNTCQFRWVGLFDRACMFWYSTALFVKQDTHKNSLILWLKAFATPTGQLTLSI